MQTDQNDMPPRRSAAHIKAPANKPTAAPVPLPISSPPRSSAAGLMLRKNEPSPLAASAPRAPRAARERTALFDRLRALRDSLPSNKNDRAVVLIKACIMEGISAGPDIVSALVYLHSDNAHVGGTLHRHTLGKGSTAHWSKGEGSRYRLLD